MFSTTMIGCWSRRQPFLRRRSRGVFALLLLLVVPTLASARKPAAAPSPLTLTLTPASKTVELSGSFNSVATFHNRGTKPITFSRPDTISKDLHRSLEMRDRKGVVYQLRRWTKGGVPYRVEGQPLILQPDGVHEFPLALQLTHEEHSDYRFMRTDQPDSAEAHQGLVTLPPGPYQVRARYRHTTSEDGVEHVIDVASDPVTIEFR